MNVSTFSACSFSSLTLKSILTTIKTGVGPVSVNGCGSVRDHLYGEMRTKGELVLLLKTGVRSW